MSATTDPTAGSAARRERLKYRGASVTRMADHDHYEEHYREFDDERDTAPMQPYTTGQVVTGAIVALVGIALTFGLPLLF